MAADVDWHAAPLHRFGKTLEVMKMEVLAVKAGRVLTPKRAHRGDRLVGARAALMEIQAQRVELLLEPATADAQDDAAARKHVGW